MSIQRLKNVEGSFLLSKILTDAGTHTFTVGATSGNVQVSSSHEILVSLGDGTNVLNSAGGTNFMVGASSFSQIMVSTEDPGTSVAMRLVSGSTSSSSSIPAWANQFGYVASGYAGGAYLPTVSRYEAVSKTWSNSTPVLANIATSTSSATSNRGVAGYAHNSYVSGVMSHYKFSYPTETWSNLTSAATSAGLYYHTYGGVCWEPGTAGYNLGGYNGGHVGYADKFSWPTDTMAYLGNIMTGRYGMYSFHHSSNNTGYILGGRTTAATQSDGDTWDMTTDTKTYVAGVNGGVYAASVFKDNDMAAILYSNSQSIFVIDYPSYTASFSGATRAWRAKAASYAAALSFENYGLWHGGDVSGTSYNFATEFDFATFTTSHVIDKTSGTYLTGYGHNQYSAFGLFDV